MHKHLLCEGILYLRMPYLVYGCEGNNLLIYSYNDFLEQS